jgi:hypothetical protein
MTPESRSSPLPDNGSLARVSAATDINKDISVTTGEKQLTSRGSAFSSVRPKLQREFNREIKRFIRK